MAWPAGNRHIAIIPARGGSKRLPRKNVIDFLGKPILGWSLDAAHATGLFDRVLVSTEDAEIAEIARSLGGEVDARPSELGGDAITVADVCVELLQRLAQQGETYATMTVLYATAPLRSAADIRATFELLEPGACDHALAVTEYDHPVHQALTRGKKGDLMAQFPDWVSRRKDTVPAFYCGNGSTYCVGVDDFLKTRSFYGPGMRGHIMPRERSIDIDTRADYELALFYANRGGS
jgi:N-acylneuraminate cytidylyltransferase